MTEHAVVIAGGGPTGLMLAGELALAGVDVAIVERRASQALPGSRAGGLHSRTIEVLDQRGIADRFLTQGKIMQVAGFAFNPLDISDFPTRHNYGLALWQESIERILAAWVDELKVPIHRGREVTGFAQDDTGVDVEVSDGRSLRAMYLVGCDGGRSLIRKKAGIDFPGSDPSVSYLIAEVEMIGEPELGIRQLRVFTLLHDARPVLLNLGEPGAVDIAPWADRVQRIDARYAGVWELPVLGAVAAPTAVLIRPDGYVAWVGDLTQLGLADALTTWFGPPPAA
jgi:2-polyprenyl-6-methoxyphenol hydroxylase-like FAD-dependent oxidoreductase